MVPRGLALLTFLTVGSMAFAGCSGGNGGAGGDPLEAAENIDVQATATTGVIRGVVVDDAIRPVPDVEIVVAGPTPANSKTGTDGLFGFEGLDPGTYFMTAGRPGYGPTQSSVEVVAGVDDPAIVKILLIADPFSGPRVTTEIWEGFIDCSISFIAAGFAACATLGGEDDFDVDYNPAGVPDFVQSEMHWKSTQTVAPNLIMSWSRVIPGQSLLDNWEQDQGTSPLLNKADRARIDEVGLGGDMDCGGGDAGCLYIRIFNGPIDGTNPTCVPRPVLGGCTTGVGVTIKQKFTIITNVFYSTQPPEGWLYAVDGPFDPK